MGSACSSMQMFGKIKVTNTNMSLIQIDFSLSLLVPCQFAGLALSQVK